MLNKRWLKREKVHAVHDNKLEQFLISLGVHDGIMYGQYKCLNCDTKITFNKLGAIVPNNNEIQFICDQPSCLINVSLDAEGSND
jgi:hypothetical protein